MPKAQKTGSAAVRVALLPSAYAPAVGGVEELTHRLAGQLTAAGDAVEVWTNRHPKTLPLQETIEDVDVRRFELPLPSAQLLRAMSFPRAASIALGQLSRAAQQFRPDILHVQCFSANGVYASALSRRRGIPLVVSLQGETMMDDNDIYEHSALLRAGLRFGLRRAAAVTACSRFVLDDAEHRFGLRPGVGLVIPNGIDIDDRPTGLPLDVPFPRFLLGVGRLVEKKGFDLLLEAFSLLAADHPDVGLVIGGDGAARPDLVRRARGLGIDKRVLFPGRLSREEIAWAMESATVFVLPSRIEPFGIVVLEALRGGRPVVVSARGGATEIVQDGRDGLIVDPLNTRAMAAAITRLLESEALRSRLAQGARLRAQDFAWTSVAARYRDLYPFRGSGSGGQQ